MKNNIHSSILQNSVYPYALLEMVFGKRKQPVDYRYIEVNTAFEKTISKKAEEIIGKTYKETARQLSDADDKRIAMYAEAIFKEKDKIVEYFSPQMDRWFKIHIQPHGEQMVSVILEDISEEKLRAQANADLNFLNKMAFKLSNLAVATNVAPKIIRYIKEYTGADFALFNEYDEKAKVLRIKKIIADDRVLNKIVKTGEKAILNTVTPVSDKVYREMITETVKCSNSFNEMSLGALSPVMGKALQKTTGIKKLTGAVHCISGYLYGTTLLGFKENRPMPSKKFMRAYAQLAGLAIRRYHTEKQLAAKEKQLIQITENISDVVFTTDLKLRLNYITPSVKKLTGISPDDYIKMPLTRKYPISEIKKFKKILKEELENEKNPEIDKNRTRMVESQLCKADGSLITVAMHLSVLRDEDGNASGFLGVKHDITQIKQTEQQLTQYVNDLNRLNKNKDTFMSVLAHDLRSPFSGMIGLTEIIKDNIETFDRQTLKKQLTKLHETLNNTRQLTEDLLLWARAQSDRLDFSPEALNLSEAVTEVLKEVQSRAEKKQILLTTDFDKKMQLFADKNLFKFLLRNLISNAIKFSYSGGEVKIRAEKEDKCAGICVCDQGTGIAPEALEKIKNTSEPYTSLGTDKEKGSGLGLMLCKEFTEKHGGQLKIESKENIGTVVKFTMPIAH